MTNQLSIKCVSSVLDQAIPAGENYDAVMEGIKTAYPYFVPARYHSASAGYKKAGYSPAMLAAAQPYMGNWLLFCDYVQGPGIVEVPAAAEPDLQVKKSELVVVEIVEEIIAPVVATDKDDNTIIELVIDEITVVDESPVLNIIDEVIVVAEPEILLFEEAQKGAAETTDSQLAKEEEALITPMVSVDYFLLKGEKVPDELPAEINSLKTETETEAEKALMVMMSFSDWLLHFKNSGERQQEETRDQKALKSMWQKEKLAAAMEEENEEIPENVFKMAVDSITPEEGMASETLADIYIRQGKYDHAIDMYKKLSLLNPQKNTYFARKIEEALKNKQS